MGKVWTVLVVLVALLVALNILWSAWLGRPLNPLTAIAASGYIGGYCLARIAEAWGIQLWESAR